MQFALSVKLSIILMNVFAKGQMVRLYQQNDVDDEMLPEESSVENHESSMQSEQQLSVSL